MLWRFEQVGLIWWLALGIILAVELVVLLCIRKRSVLCRIAIPWFVFIPYLFFVLAATVLSRTPIPKEYDLISLDVSTAWTVGPGIYGLIDTASELGMNVAVFIPIGYLLARITNGRKWLVFGACLLITLGIEALQLITKRGFFELADMLLNMTGAVIGYLLFCLMRCIRHRNAAK